MKSTIALVRLKDFLREMVDRHGRRQLACGHCCNIINNEHWTVLWLDGDRHRCVGYLRTRYLGNDEYEVETRTFDTPRPHTSLAPVARCAFTSVTMERVVAISTQRPVHGNN